MFQMHRPPAKTKPNKHEIPRVNVLPAGQQPIPMGNDDQFFQKKSRGHWMYDLPIESQLEMAENNYDRLKLEWRRMKERERLPDESYYAQIRDPTHQRPADPETWTHTERLYYAKQDAKTRVNDLRTRLHLPVIRQKVYPVYRPPPPAPPKRGRPKKVPKRKLIVYSSSSTSSSEWGNRKVCQRR